MYLTIMSQVVGLGLTLCHLHFQNLPDFFFYFNHLPANSSNDQCLHIFQQFSHLKKSIITNNKLFLSMVKIYIYTMDKVFWVFCIEQNKYFMAQIINNLHIEQQEQSTVVVHAFNGLPSPSWWGEGTLENIGRETYIPLQSMGLPINDLW